jgi:hypothetical protein
MLCFRYEPFINCVHWYKSCKFPIFSALFFINLTHISYAQVELKFRSCLSENHHGDEHLCSSSDHSLPEGVFAVPTGYKTG